MKEDVLDHLNMSSDQSNVVPDVTSVQAVAIPVMQAHARTEVVLDDKTVPVSGFTKAMVKTMTEAMVSSLLIMEDVRYQNLPRLSKSVLDEFKVV